MSIITKLSPLALLLLGVCIIATSGLPTKRSTAPVCNGATHNQYIMKAFEAFSAARKSTNCTQLLEENPDLNEYYCKCNAITGIINKLGKLSTPTTNAILTMILMAIMIISFPLLQIQLYKLYHLRKKSYQLYHLRKKRHQLLVYLRKKRHPLTTIQLQAAAHLVMRRYSGGAGQLSKQTSRKEKRRSLEATSACTSYQSKIRRNSS